MHCNTVLYPEAEEQHSTMTEDMGFGGGNQRTDEDQVHPTEAVNTKALQVIQRIRDKLSGRQ